VAESIEETLAARNKRYGTWREHARIAQNIKAALRDSPNWEKLTPYMRETFEMFAQKAGRILNGDPFYDDSWHDIIGYFQLVENHLKEVEQPNE